MAKKLNMMLHCGARTVEFGEVKETTTPKPTASHFPLAHARVAGEVRSQVEAGGLTIVNEAHALMDGCRQKAWDRDWETSC